MTNKKRDIKVTIPQMGNLAIPIRGMLRRMGANVILPPSNNKETLSFGTRHSAETVCLPYKLILGNFIHGLEAGANTVLMFQAPGTCRLGNYATNIEATLNAMRKEDVTITDEPFKLGFTGPLIAFVEDPDGTLIELIER